MRSFRSGQAVWKWGSLPRPVLARRSGSVVSGSCAALLLLVLTGCASRLPEKAPHPSVVPTRSSSAGTGAPTAARGIEDSESTPPTGAGAAATTIAENATAAFCQPHLPARQWLHALTPLLASEAASAFASVLPSRVPCSRVTGSAAAGIGDEVTRRVEVPTDAGVVSVTVERPDPDSPWRVGCIAVPERR